MAADTWIFRRSYQGHVVKVTAIWMPRTETWGLICRLDGVMSDMTQSIDPWPDSRAMLDRVLFELAETFIDADLLEPEPEDLLEDEPEPAPVRRVKEGDTEEHEAH